MDMLVKLYNVHDDEKLFEKLKEDGVSFKRAMPPDLNRVKMFVQEHFGDGWANECTVAVIKNHCWLAVKNKEIIGFSCYDTTMPDFFGPTGVDEAFRGQGIGKALLLRGLLSLKEMGYAYAIIGWAGPTAFYEKAVGAVPIPDSVPYSYQNMVQVEI